MLRSEQGSTAQFIDSPLNVLQSQVPRERNLLIRDRIEEEGMEMKMRRVVKEKRFWVASFLLAWAAALQGHMMWMQRQDAFKQKFPSNSNANDDHHHASADS